MIHVSEPTLTSPAEMKTYAQVLEQVLGVGIDIESTRVVLGEVESRDLWDVLILALTLLLLKLEGDTADWTTLDTSHEMGGVTSDLIENRVCQNKFKNLPPVMERAVEPCCGDAWKR